MVVNSCVDLKFHWWQVGYGGDGRGVPRGWVAAARGRSRTDHRDMVCVTRGRGSWHMMTWKAWTDVGKTLFVVCQRAGILAAPRGGCLVSRHCIVIGNWETKRKQKERPFASFGKNLHVCHTVWRGSWHYGNQRLIYEHFRVLIKGGVGAARVTGTGVFFRESKSPSPWLTLARRCT